jgi:hypothetical protein
VGKLGIALALLTTVIAGLFPACSKSGGVVHVGTNVNEASLVEIWSSVFEAVDFQDSSANLDALIFDIGENGSFDFLHFEFYAMDAQGLSKIYFVNSEFDGAVSCYSCDIASVLQRTHPLHILQELDAVPLTAILRESTSARIEMDFQAGSVTYSSEYSHLYHLENGNLKPLKSVVFRTSTSWGVIYVHRNPSGNAGTSIMAELWFPTSELGKAESVEYI